MKLQKIFILTALMSIFLFSSCSKEATVLPSNKSNINETETLTTIGDDEDDEYIIIRPKPKSQQTGALLIGANIELYNAENSFSGVVNAAGDLEFITPNYGIYDYKVTLNNEVLLLKSVNINSNLTEIEDYL